MGLFDFFKPKIDVAKATDSVSNLVKTIGATITNDIPPEQRGELLSKYLDLSKNLTDMQAKIITTEMQGSWLQRNWRPLLAIMIVAIIGINYLFVPIVRWFGVSLQPLDLPEQLWTVLKISLGGYIVGRSAEKVATTLRK